MNRNEITVVGVFLALMLGMGLAVAILWADVSARSIPHI